MARRRSVIPIFITLLLVLGYILWERYGTYQKNTQGEEVVTIPSTTGSNNIQVYFSNAYGNDSYAGEYDAENIDRKVVMLLGLAQTSIDCALYELESDRIADALIGAKDRGVTVRIVAESDYLNNPEIQRVIRSGIGVVGDNRSAFMHNKFIVADRQVVWTGSMNATNNGAWRNNNNGLLIRSTELAGNYTAEFNEMYEQRQFGPRSPSNTPHTLVKLPEADVYNYFSPEDDPHSKILRFVKLAKHRIRFLAYTMTDDALGSLLIEKHRKGVDVAGVLEKRQSSLPYSELQRLQQAGVNVLTDGNKYIMHHKVIVIDGMWTIVGSFNFSDNARRNNDENILIIKNHKVAEAFEEEYERIRRMGL